MFTFFRGASAAPVAGRKQGHSLPSENAFQKNLQKLTRVSRFLFIALAISCVATSCVKDDDDVQCGDENNPCTGIVIDEMGDG